MSIFLEKYGCNTLGTAQVSALGRSEASAPHRFKCISIMGDSNGGSTTVRSRGGVLSREGRFRRFHCIHNVKQATFILSIHSISILLMPELQHKTKGIFRSRYPTPWTSHIISIITAKH